MNSGPPAHETGVLPLNYAAKTRKRKQFKKVLLLNPMVVEEILGTLPMEVVDKLVGFITFLQAIGILFSLYLIVMIIKAFFTFKTNKIIKEIADDIKKIKKKLKIK